MRANFSLRLPAVLLFCAYLAGGCASPRVFSANPAVNSWDNAQPSPLPQKTDFRYTEYAVSSTIRHPLINDLDARREPASQDVNSMDEVPASTWYTPRLGYQQLSAADLSKGPEEIGPPRLPMTVIKSKKGGNNPGFVVTDARGIKYLLKFDSPLFPDLDSTINYVTNRLFWAFGYNVPEDYIFYFSREDLKIPEKGDFDPQAVEFTLLTLPQNNAGKYRCTASLFLQGEILGPIAQKGMRKGDINDTIPHEDLRILRALRVFCAFTNQSGMRSDNSLDVYEGEPGKGHTVHYLLDFGEAMGNHALGKNRAWDGFEHYFTWQDMTKNIFNLGLKKKPWEKIAFDSGEPRSNFEAEQFTFKKWKESIPFEPIRKSQPDDDYWAAKILASLRREHLEELFREAAHPDKEYTHYLITTLLERREKILRHSLSAVTPLESRGIKENRLYLHNFAQGLSAASHTRYAVRFFNQGKKEILDQQTLEENSADFYIPLPLPPEGMLSCCTQDYIRIEVTLLTDGKQTARPAEFHIRQKDGRPFLAGVVH